MNWTFLKILKRVVARIPLETCSSEQVTNCPASLSDFFYGVDLKSIEDMSLIFLGVGDKLDLLAPSNELFMLAEHRI